MKKPNLLFISTDQQSFHALSAYGNPYVKTPNMDRLCREGVSFMRCYSTDPVCTPARTTWMTGCYSSETGVAFNDAVLHEHIPDLGTILNSNGYYAAHSGKWHVDGRDVRQSFHTVYNGKRDILAGGAEFYDNTITHGAIDFLTSYEGEQPFYLQVNYLNPHDICEYLHSHEFKDIPDLVSLGMLREDELPPLPDNFHYDQNETVLQRVCRREKGALIHDKIRIATEEWTEVQWRYYIWHYYRFIEKVDREIGNLLNVLEQTPYKENTLILFTSDHGEACASHRMFQKFTLYEESVRVPYVAACLGNGIQVAKGTVDHKHLISGIDYVRTICDYAGLEPPAGVHGRSLKPLIEGQQVTEWRDSVYIESNYYGRAIVTDRYKYIMEYTPNEQNRNLPPNSKRNQRGLVQLFDLAEDPGETKNLATDPAYEGIISQLQAEISFMESSLVQEPITHPQAVAIIEQWSDAIASYWRRMKLSDGQKETVAPFKPDEGE
ncbi:sulfatase family protein [Paenibacillus ehimensis]|uniref:sulfatase family protein n=1 Tax=Paenibacillus ehimensis TaxID=79264 RepID=UPI000FD702D0|nr:sulfatase-like hydrolase/transferase [Paenibacillus ehimensis]